MPTLDELSRRLESGATSARSLVETALQRIANPAGEGSRVFISVAAEAARAQADAIDRVRAAGQAPSAFAGIPITVKDLFDVAGEVTTAGSRVLKSRAPATQDAPVVARLRAAGFIFIGRTNMTEFAYSGLGLNPHYGTPLNPFDRVTARIPGGSSSGAAVAITDGMAAASLGTDTGGSCRIPAALTGIVGFKPTAHRVPREGVLPLSLSLDSVGPLGRSVSCCATLDALLRNAEPRALPMLPMSEVRLLAPTTLVLDELDDAVAHAFESAIETLARAGATIVRAPVDELQRVHEINAKGGVAAAEAYAWHRRLLEREAHRYDPRVAHRILKGREQSPEDLRVLRAQRQELIAAMDERTRAFDALAAPTAPIIAPPLAAFEHDSEYLRLNALVLRNPSLANLLDRCSISLPIHTPGEAPVGLMLIGAHEGDERLLEVARAIERVLPRNP